MLGTFVTITAYGPNRPATLAAVSAAFAQFDRVDASMSSHREDSELSRLNRNAAQKPVPVSPELFHVLLESQRIAQATDGAFDFTIRPLLDLWGFLRRDYRLPSDAEVRRALGQTGFGQVRLVREQRTVQFEASGISIDLGGIAKGHAVDLAIDTLKEHGMAAAMVNAGGDLRVFGAPPGGKGWRIQIRNPAAHGANETIVLRDGAIATSGNYANFFEIGERRFSHILNPGTGWPVEGVVSCSVLAPTCMAADAWATACFVMGPGESRKRIPPELGFRLVVGDLSGPPESLSTVWNGRFEEVLPARLSD